MSFVLKPWQLLLMALAGWVNLCQQQRIDFQDDEIQILLRLLARGAFGLPMRSVGA